MPRHLATTAFFGWLLAVPFLPLHSALAGCPLPDPSPADGITALVADEGDAELVGTRIPLILVHGLHGNQNPQDGTDTIAYKNREYWSKFVAHLSADTAFRAKYKLFRFHYVSDVYPVWEIARAFRNTLDAALSSGTLPDIPFVLIAHSMGGLVARSYMQEHSHVTGLYCGQRGGARIAKLITLATPHHGTPAANDAPRINPLVYPGWELALTVIDRTYWCKQFPCVSDEFVDVTDPNRSDLRWDSYNGLEGYDECPRECNAWLQTLNADRTYDGKLTAYYGFVNSSNSSLYNALDDLGPFELLVWLVEQTRTDTEKLAAVAVILKKVYSSFDNDGLVPVDSAAFHDHTLAMRVECPRYDHLDMKDSRVEPCANGLGLFQSLQNDLGLGSSLAADFTGDGKPDLLWQHATSGDVYLWAMDGLIHTGGTYLAQGMSPWQVAGTPDLTGDGQPDLLWQHATSGDVYLWPMNGTTQAGGTYLARNMSPWKVVATGDFCGQDDKPDIVWQHETSGDVYLWCMSGTTLTSGTYLAQGMGPWKVVAAADLNNDGSVDLLWQHDASGDVYIWFMNGTTQIGGTYLASGLGSWKVVATADLNGDGAPDLLWQHATTGDVYVWLLNGTTVTSGAYLAQNMGPWKMVGPK